MKRFHIVTATVVLAELILVLFVLLPLWQAGNQRKGDIELTKRTIEFRQQQGQADDELTYTSRLVRTQQLRRFFIRTEDDIAFFERLEQLAHVQAVDLDIRFLTEPTPGEPRSIALSLTVEGAYENVLRYVSALGVQPFAARLTRLTVEALPAAEGIRAILSLDTLWR